MFAKKQLISIQINDLAEFLQMKLVRKSLRTVIRTHTGYAQNAHKTDILGLRRTRLV